MGKGNKISVTSFLNVPFKIGKKCDFTSSHEEKITAYTKVNKDM